MRLKYILQYSVFGVLLMLLWEYFGSNHQSVRFLISSPSLIASYFLDNSGSLWLATLTTFYEASFGLALATLFSFTVMIFCFLFPPLMRFLIPLMITSQVIPVIVLAPFFILWLGIGVESKIAMAAVISFFPIFINFSQGYKAIDEEIHDLLNIYGSKKIFRVLKVYFPLSTPSIMAGLKVSATLAVIGAIVAEFTGAKVGLGKNLFLSAIRLEPDLLMASLICSSLLGGVLYLFIVLIEKFVGSWYVKMRM